MPPYTHFFHLTIIFLVSINSIIRCDTIPGRSSASSLEEQLLKWVNYPVRSKPAKHKLFPSYNNIITVDQNPDLGDFTTIQAAIDSLPIINLVRVVINVHSGIYTEKVIIPKLKSFITIQGAGAENTIVRWNDTAGTPGPRGLPLGTFASATFGVNSPYFIAKNITFQNTAPVPPAGAIGKQAVALRISADAAAFVGCKFLGGQDTLYDHKGRHYYKDCYLEGSVDFIFGNARSLFENCELHAIDKTLGVLTAQDRSSESEETGFSFVNCKVTGTGAVFLGRAWGPYARVVFSYTHMDDIIIPQGWSTKGHDDDPSTQMSVFFGQYKCSGAGANVTGRVAWSRVLSDEEAKPFISLSFIDGSQWLHIPSLHMLA